MAACESVSCACAAAAMLAACCSRCCWVFCRSASFASTCRLHGRASRRAEQRPSRQSSGGPCSLAA